jgi:hypothetical protein
MAVDSLTLLPVLLCTMGHNCFIASKYPKLVSERPVSGKYFYSYELPFWVGFDKFSLSINEICE